MLLSIGKDEKLFLHEVFHRNKHSELPICFSLIKNKTEKQKYCLLLFLEGLNERDFFSLALQFN